MPPLAEPAAPVIRPHPGLTPGGDAASLRRAYGCFPTGVVAVCALPRGDAPIGMAASSFTSVSLDPPLVSVCIQDTSTTWPRLRSMPTLGVSVLADGQAPLSRQLAGPAAGRFAALDPLVDAEGAVFIPGSTAHLSCTIAHEIAAGDHTLVLLRIRALLADPGVEPLVFHAGTYRQLRVGDGGHRASR
ncbi:MAG: flavin reductase family protein [Gordonia sp. (in: high G+C Gram-positive bacteria)]